MVECPASPCVVWVTMWLKLDSRWAGARVRDIASAVSGRLRKKGKGGTAVGLGLGGSGKLGGVKGEG